MTEPRKRDRWAIALLVVVLSLAAGIAGYNMGLAQGAAQAAAAAGGTAPLPPYGYRPWGFGPVFPLLLLVWVFAFTALRWGGPPWRRWPHPGVPYDRETFDEWHRRAHDQMKS